jgi:hypothetical protein
MWVLIGLLALFQCVLLYFAFVEIAQTRAQDPERL